MQMGGVIGGVKFCVSGILFKGECFQQVFHVTLKIMSHSTVARPSIDNIGEEEAQKICGHELKSLTALFNVNMVNHIGLALPMMCLLDCCGFRLGE
jgi:hypothetical protein